MIIKNEINDNEKTACTIHYIGNEKSQRALEKCKVFMCGLIIRLTSEYFKKS